ncbi:MAG TPA: class I SAM-dependent methyltransferase, partial [Candidatus Aquilonibacter sp.]
LITFHRAFRGDGGLSLFHTDIGETSYRAAAQRVRMLAPDARDVLDIGCGDGKLLAEIASEFDNDVNLHGVDLSDDQVARARASLPLATIRCADAADDLGKARFDVIVAHFSLLIMTRVRRVLTNTAAALRPGGTVALLTEDPSVPDSIFALVRSGLVPVVHHLPGLRMAIPEREPVERDDALLTLLEDVGLRDHHVERFTMRAVLSRDQLWDFARSTYLVGLLEDAVQRELRTSLEAQAGAALSEDGRIPVTLPLRFVSARA